MLATVVLLILAVLAAAPAVFDFAFDCGGSDVRPPPDPDSLRGRLCAAEGFVSVLMVLLPAAAVAAGGAISTARREWTALFFGLLAAGAAIALGLYITELPRL